MLRIALLGQLLDVPRLKHNLCEKLYFETLKVVVYILPAADESKTRNVAKEKVKDCMMH